MDCDLLVEPTELIFSRLIKLPKLQLLSKKICTIWPLGGTASILNISVFARFDHVPLRFRGFSLAEMNKPNKIQPTKEEKNSKGYCLFVRKSRLSKLVIPSFASWALEALFVAEKSYVVNQNDKKIIEEDSSFHLTHQTLISVHW